uniref:RING-type E3 ubiquitin transferase n=1 Tax=Timema douglasi TaxID=61478 RepID=A0A7R8VA51_TIMDO|nr:unnamed protein product [Timema douglasi]
MFECNICLDTARDAVVSIWPCLHQWLETRPNRQVCPVCKAAISKEKVVPLYGRGSTKQEDPSCNVQTPVIDSEIKFPLDQQGSALNLRTMLDFLGLDLVMEAFICLLVLELSPLDFLLLHLTSVNPDQVQLLEEQLNLMKSNSSLKFSCG